MTAIRGQVRLPAPRMPPVAEAQITGQAMFGTDEQTTLIAQAPAEMTTAVAT
jgi:hypothetical protein